MHTAPSLSFSRTKSIVCLVLYTLPLFPGEGGGASKLWLVFHCSLLEGGHDFSGSVSTSNDWVSRYWMVNSIMHMWGTRRFLTPNGSRNNLLIALLTGGEGWHNNHHAYPVSARHGFAWYEIDLNYYGICLLKFLGLVSRVKATTLSSVKAG
jgi:hypothetical protein